MNIFRRFFGRLKVFLFEENHSCPRCGGSGAVGRNQRVNYYSDWLLQNMFLLISILLFVAMGLFLRFNGFTYGEVLSGGMDSDGSSIESISISNSMMVDVDNRYNQNMEKAWCMFGEVRDDKVFVKEMDFVDNPVSQSERSLSTYCMDEIGSNRFDLLSAEFNFLGLTHTHPDSSSRLSFRDIHTLGQYSYIADVMGVYDGEQLNYWSNGELQDDLDLVVRKSYGVDAVKE